MVNYESAMEISEDEFSEIINNSHKLVVVDFFNEWHMPCIMLTPIIDDLDEQMKEVKFVKINKEDNEELVKRHGVSTIPCLVIFKEGKEVERIIGSHSADLIERKIMAYLC